MEKKLIYTRLPDGDDGGYLKHPGCLIYKEQLAFAIMDNQLEIHYVKPSSDPNEYGIVSASDSLFFVGDTDLGVVLHDAENLSLLEFAKKYPHPKLVTVFEQIM